MNQFRRAVRFVLFLTGAVLGLLATVCLYLARFVLHPPRQALWATPRHFGLDYEEVRFPARDGVRLSGWFVPAAGGIGRRPAVVLAHGWPWNRLGSSGGGPLEDLPGSRPVEFLPLVVALHEAGYHVLMFDLRNHGESAAAPPVTFGFLEANDVLGALAYLQGRQDVHADRLGLVGFSLGANAILFSLARGAGVRAAIAVQPTSPKVFSQGYSRFLLGPFGGLLAAALRAAYPVLAGGLRFSAIDPVFAAAAAGPTPVLYVQGMGDPWGSVRDVTRMVAVTRGAVEPHFPPAANRYDGYQYVLDNPAVALDFLAGRL